MQLQWFPGHMAKTRRLIEENLKVIDIVVELIDARIPFSGRNTNFDSMLGSKKRIIVMNKSDLADDRVTNEWLEYYRKKGINVISVNALSGQGVKKILSSVTEVFKEKIERDLARGMKRPIKMMIVGIPNVGKSSLINNLVGKSSAKTGDRPGVTKGKQWLHLKNGMDLLDTPGILPTRFDNQRVGLHLAFTGAIRDEIMDIETLSTYLLEKIKERYAHLLVARYKLDDIDGLKGFEILEMIGKKRGFIISKGEIDTHRAANILLDEFRGCKIGKISLERPEDVKALSKSDVIG